MTTKCVYLVGLSLLLSFTSVSCREAKQAGAHAGHSRTRCFVIQKDLFLDLLQVMEKDGAGSTLDSYLSQVKGANSGNRVCPTCNAPYRFNPHFDKWKEALAKIPNADDESDGPAMYCPCQEHEGILCVSFRGRKLLLKNSPSW